MCRQITRLARAGVGPAPSMPTFIVSPAAPARAALAAEAARAERQRAEPGRRDLQQEGAPSSAGPIDAAHVSSRRCSCIGGPQRIGVRVRRVHDECRDVRQRRERGAIERGIGAVRRRRRSTLAAFAVVRAEHGALLLRRTRAARSSCAAVGRRARRQAIQTARAAASSSADELRARLPRASDTPRRTAGRSSSSSACSGVFELRRRAMLSVRLVKSKIFIAGMRRVALDERVERAAVQIVGGHARRPPGSCRSCSADSRCRRADTD